MEMFTEKTLCGLCLGVITNKNFKVIEEVTRDILKVLLLKLNLETLELQVMCKVCSTKVFAAYNFKSTCLDTEDKILTVVDKKETTPIDLKDFYLKKTGSTNGQQIADISDYEVCRLCMNLVNNGFMHLKDVPDNNIIHRCIPELNLKATENPIICQQCFISLEAYNGFLKDCLDAEENIKSSTTEGKLVSEVDIKFEEVEIKSEVGSQDSFRSLLILDSGIVKTEEIAAHSRNVATTKRTEKEIKHKGRAGKQELGHEDSSFLYEHRSSENMRMKLTKTYTCDKCGFLTNRKYTLAQHQNTHKNLSDTQRYKCDKCDYRTNWKRSLTRHRIIHRQTSEVEMHQCDKCDYQTKWINNLKVHQVRHEDSPEVPTYTCDKCDYRTGWKVCLAQHQIKHKDPLEVQTYKCEKCDFQTKWKSHITQHRITHQGQMNRCDKCNYQTVNKSSLVRHQIIHKDASEVRMYKCDKCNYQTKWKNSYTAHHMVHKDISEVEVYKCGLCDFQSKRKIGVRRHQVIHDDYSEVRMYKCDPEVKCDYNSINQKLEHSTQRYKCGNCDFQTKHKQSLIRHQLLHKDPSGLRMYKCDKCDYQSKWKRCLLQHYKVHRDISELQMYRCEECGFQTRWKGGLVQHQIKHKDPSEVAAYKCDKCDYHTSWKSTLTRHRLTHKDLLEAQPKFNKSLGMQTRNCDSREKQKDSSVKHGFLMSGLSAQTFDVCGKNADVGVNPREDEWDAEMFVKAEEFQISMEEVKQEIWENNSDVTLE